MNLTDEDIKHLADSSNLENITKLTLSGNGKLTDKSIKYSIFQKGLDKMNFKVSLCSVY